MTSPIDLSKLLDITEEGKRHACQGLTGRIDGIVLALIQALKEFKHVKYEKIDPRHVECLFIRAQGCFERTKQALDQYYTMKLNIPKFFQDRDPTAPGFLLPLETVSCAIQHTKSGSGHRVLCMKLSKESKYFKIHDFYKVLLMFLELLARGDYVSDLCFVQDYTNLTGAHLMKFEENVIKQALFAMQGPFVVSIKQMHFVNVPDFAEEFLDKFKSWLRRDLRQQLFTHKDFESLHEVVDKWALPEDFGGDQPPIKETQDLWVAELRNCRDIFVEEETCASPRNLETGGKFGFLGENVPEKNGSILEVSKEFKSNALNELDLTKKEVEKGVQEVVGWIKAQLHLENVKPDLRQIECLFVRSKGNIERTNQAIDDYYTMKTKVPELFMNRDPLVYGKDFTQSFEGFSCAILNDDPSSNYRVLVLKSQPDADNFKIYDFYKVLLMFLEIKTRLDYANEYIFVLDYSNLKEEHVPKINREAMSKLEAALKGPFLIQFKGFHFINYPSFAEPIVTEFKSVLDEEAQEKIFIHKNLASLHEVVNKSLLPEDLGGTQKPLKEIEDLWFHELLNWRDWFVEEEKYTSDESKRSEANINNELAENGKPVTA